MPLPDQTTDIYIFCGPNYNIVNDIYILYRILESIVFDDTNLEQY